LATLQISPKKGSVSRAYWRSVAAAVKEIESMDTAGRFDQFVDLHNPGADSKIPSITRAHAISSPNPDDAT
jgi:hypothetical protein